MTNRAKLKVVTAMVAMVLSANVWAGLGKINVRSSLGEPFRADIELTGTRPGELDATRVSLAPPDTFRDLNVDYTPILNGLRFSVAPGRGGNPTIRVSSTAPISEPYLRFVVEARTAGNRSVREYTVLLDPAGYGAAPAPIVQDAPAYADTRLSSRYLPSRGAARASLPEGPLYVAPGTTLRELALRIKPANATVNQAMAALFSANPQAFIAGNPHRLKAGVTLKAPAPARMRQLSDAEARALLAGTPVGAEKPAARPVDPSSPQAAATVAPTTPAAGALKLVPAEPASADKLTELQQQITAREQALRDAEARISALEQQIRALQPGLPPVPPAASAPVAEAVAASEPVAAPAPAPVAPPAVQPSPAPAASQPTPAPVEAGPSMLDSMIDNLPVVGGGVAATVLLGLLGLMMARRRKASAAGASLRLGKNVAAPTGLAAGAAATAGSGMGHSFMTNFTQAAGAIDTGEVDPVAEAEVYIAYGRDAQAEEILRDALAKDPTRHEVRLKLMEIYASRPDPVAFEPLARELHAAFDGKGALWAKAAAMGLAIDPTNPLYQGTPSASDDSATLAPAAAAPIDLDQELFGTAEEPVQAPVAAVEPIPVQPEPVEPVPDEADDPLRAALFADDRTPETPEPVAEPEAESGNMLDFDLDTALGETLDQAPERPAAPAPAEDNLLDFDFNLDSLTSDKPAPPVAADNGPVLEIAEDEQQAAGASGFDALFEDMAPAPSGGTVPPAATATAALGPEGLALDDNPHTTQLDLARVYIDMGDQEGAREVLNDLVREADGSVREEAERLLAQLKG